MNLHALKNLLRWRTAPHELGEKLINADRVLTGLLVEAQAAPDMTVKVSAGLVRQKEETKYLAASASLAVTAADADDERIDLVTVKADGTLAMVDGEPGEGAPALPAGSIELARITVPAADTTIGQAQISHAERPMI